MTQRISYKVFGEVQGVNFRAFTIEQGKKLGLTGKVANDPSGHVSGEAQGEESKIKEFLEHLNKGPSAASVDRVEHQSIDVKQGESDFTR